MGWKRLKWILVAILVVANGFLLVQILALYRSVANVPEEALGRITRMLAQEGIVVAEDAIDTAKPEFVVYQGDFGEEYYTRVAESLSGSTTARFFNTPNGFVMNMDSGDRVAFQGGFGILYESAVAPDTLREEEEWSGLAPLSGREERKMRRLVLGKLALSEALSVDPTRPSFDESFLYMGKDTNDGTMYCVVQQTIRGVTVVTQRVVIAVVEEQVVRISGNWCFQAPHSATSAQLMDQINILYSVKDRLLDEKEEAGTLCGIHSLQMEYAPYFHSSEDHYYLVPMWKILMEDGRELLVNAADGSLYTN